MRILVGWDNPEQADLVSMYLGIGDHSAEVEIGGDKLLARLNSDEQWDVLFLSVTLPDVETGFDTFEQIKRLRPDLSIVGACEAGEVYRVVRS